MYNSMPATGLKMTLQLEKGSEDGHWGIRKKKPPVVFQVVFGNFIFYYLNTTLTEGVSTGSAKLL